MPSSLARRRVGVAGIVAEAETSEVAIIIKPDFLTPVECAQILHGAKTLTTWDSRTEGYWSSRIAHANQLEDRELRGTLVAIRQRVRAEIVRSYDLARPLFADTLQIVRWPEGYEQSPHADAENPGGVPHPFPWRNYASLIYLNNDFEGGRIYFPNQDVTPAISPGMLVFFPGTLEYLHGITKITRGVRYTVASFWTFDSSRQDGLPL